MIDLSGKTVFFNPFLRSKEEVRTYLLDKPFGSAHPFFPVLLVRTATGFQEIDISKEDPKNFINNSDLSSIEENLTKYFKKFVGVMHLSAYSRVMVTPGQELTTSFTPGAISIYAMTEKTGEFFDLIMYYDDETVTYNRKTSNEYHHSGDVGSLLHFLIPQSTLSNKKVAVGVVGYNKKKLIDFKSQVPILIIVDHDAQTNYIVPCPLDIASMGNDSMVFLFNCVKQRDKLIYQVFSSPMRCGVHNTGDKNHEITRMLTLATTGTNSVSIVTETITNLKISTPVTLANKKIIYYLEHGLNIRSDLPFQGSTKKDAIIFGSGLGSGGHIILYPVEMSGSSSMCLGTPPTSPKFNPNAFSVVHCTEDYSDNLARTPIEWINGWIIIHTNKTDYREVNLNCLAMAGPQSTVFICSKGKYFFFRGIRGYFDVLPEVGTEVKFAQNNSIEPSISEIIINPEIMANKTLPYPPRMFKSNAQILWLNRMIKLPELIDILLKLNLEDFAKFELDIIDVITQCSIILPQNEITALSHKLISYINAMIVSDSNRAIDEFKSQEQFDLKKFKEFIGQKKGDSKKWNKTLKGLLEKVANMTSTHGIANTAQSLKRLERTMKVEANANFAKTATVDQWSSSLNAISTEHGVIYCVIDSDKIKKALKSITQGVTSQSFASIDDRVGQLDSDTAGAMWEIQNTSVNKSHDLEGDGSIFFKSMHQGSAFFVPLIDSIINERDVYKIKWTDICLNSDISLFRILLRNSLCNANSTRSFNVSPTNNEVGFLIINILLSIMENYVTHLSIPENDFDRSSCQIMRGLMGQVLTICASGTIPLTSIYQFVTYNPRPDFIDVRETEILLRIANLFPYTGWNSHILIRNLRRFIIIIFRRKITDIYTNAMIKSDYKKVENSNNFDSRNKELGWLSLVTKKIGFIDMESAQMFVNCYPFNNGHHGGGTTFIYNFLTFYIKGECNDKYYNTAKQYAMNIIARRTTEFRDIRKKLLIDRNQYISEFEAILAQYGCTLDHAPSFFKTDVGKRTVEDIDKIYKHNSNWSVTGDAPILPIATTIITVIGNWIDNLKEVPNSNGAVNLASNIPDIIKLTNASGYPMVELFKVANVNYDMISVIIKELLIGWKDAVKAEEGLMKIF